LHNPDLGLYCAERAGDGCEGGDQGQTTTAPPRASYATKPRDQCVSLRYIFKERVYRIGLANWTPEGLIGHLFRTIGKHVPPPAGVKPPALWGTEARLRELFGDGISQLKVNRRMFVFR
jgi:hypothetical protein